MARSSRSGPEVQKVYCLFVVMNGVYYFLTYKAVPSLVGAAPNVLTIIQNAPTAYQRLTQNSHKPTQTHTKKPYNPKNWMCVVGVGIKAVQ